MKLLTAIDDAPLVPVRTPGCTVTDASRKIRFRYEVLQPRITLYVAVVPKIKSVPRKKKFVCDRYDEETKTWMDEIEIDPNEHGNFRVDLTCFVFFWFRSPERWTTPRLEETALRTLLRQSPDRTEDFRRLPLPDHLKHHFLKRHRPFQYWLEYDERRIFYYHGEPASHKRLDIHLQLPEVSVGQWKYRRMGLGKDVMISKENELVIVYVPVCTFFMNSREMNRIIAAMKDGHVRNHFGRRVPIKARFIFISDYPPEALFDGIRRSHHEWFSRNCLVVEKGDASPVSSDDVPEKCVHCEKPVYFREEKWNGIPVVAHVSCQDLHHRELLEILDWFIR